MRKFAAIVTMIATMFALSAVSTAPASAASPSISRVSTKKLLPSGGENVTLTGVNLRLVTSVYVDKTLAQVVMKSNTHLVFISPAHAEGVVSLTLLHPGGSFVLERATAYRLQAFKTLVPIPYIPETLKVGKAFSMQPGNQAWVIKITNSTPKVCKVSGLLVTGLRKGECSLSFFITVDTMDPTYRSRQALYFVTIN